MNIAGEFAKILLQIEKIFNIIRISEVVKNFICPGGNYKRRTFKNG